MQRSKPLGESSGRRSRRALLAQQTVEILRRGSYVAPSGAGVELRAALADCLSGTRLLDDAALAGVERAAPATSLGETQLEVTGETSLEAVRRLVVERKLDTMCLNFASAKSPGGGFLGGAEAQEESLARASGLYASLLSQQGYYLANRGCASAFYTEHFIHSPGVPIFRDDSGALLECPHLAAFITAPAVNAGVVGEREPARVPEIAVVMRRRVARVLALSAQAGHRGLVLGAWGCGVFRNDPALIAELFAQALSTRFRGHFAHVVFAVYDRSARQACLRAFQQRLVG